MNADFRNYRRKLAGALCLMMFAMTLQSQNTSRPQAKTASFSEVMHDLLLIQRNFQPAPGKPVSCTMSYLYSKELSPTKFLDSMSGSYKALGNFHYSKLGTTESIQNDSMVVSVYNDQKSIMASPAARPNKNDAKMFLSSIDSTFVAANAQSVSVSTSGGIKTMTFHFTGTSPYYNCVLVYNAQTYVPQTISYIMRSSKLAESGKPPAEGGVITIRFSGYSTANLDASVFNVNKYVTAKAGAKGKLQVAMAGYTFYQNGDIQADTTQLSAIQRR